MTSVRRLLGCLTIAAFAMSVGVFAADEKKDKKEDKAEHTIKQIMKAVPGKTGLVAKTTTAAAGGKWEDAQQNGKELKAYGEELIKNTPKKGNKESWEKHTKGFAEVMTEIADAADKKDKAAVAAGAKKFGALCGDCHKFHK